MLFLQLQDGKDKSVCVISLTKDDNLINIRGFDLINQTLFSAYNKLNIKFILC